MSALLLAGAILAEVAGTLTLRVAATGRRVLYAVVGVAYLLAFGLLSAALAHGLPLGVAYGVWTAAGIVLTALASRLLFGEALNRVMAFGMGLIVLGVLLIELGAAH
ncbi:DMT family transporter [Brachybacterium squillarum]|uniref:DMT family transporter n=1 Tax=Brachybacterium squillarum TaxID=661979 RepID=UPI002221F158|nr:SMR family transporter [Brachybacterium squillarum]MCW1804900.1 SMR family transporter [Brachybacterium squillarum]